MFLCETCLALFPTAEDEQRAKETLKERDEQKVQRKMSKFPPDHPHQANTDTLRLAAEAGCYVCETVWERLKYYGPEDIGNRSPITCCNMRGRSDLNGKDVGSFHVTRSLPWERCEMPTWSLENFTCIPIHGMYPIVPPQTAN